MARVEATILGGSVLEKAVEEIIKRYPREVFPDLELTFAEGQRRLADGNILDLRFRDASGVHWVVEFDRREEPEAIRPRGASGLGRSALAVGVFLVVAVLYSADMTWAKREPFVIRPFARGWTSDQTLETSPTRVLRDLSKLPDVIDELAPG